MVEHVVVEGEVAGGEKRKAGGLLPLPGAGAQGARGVLEEGLGEESFQKPRART